MKKIIPLLTFAFVLHLFSASAAVPCPWTVEMTRAKPATFEYYQGETIDFKATLMASGKPFESPSNYSFFWQTNGMGNLYWEAPQQGGAGVPPAQSNVLFATWLPSYDVGARVYKCFIGSPSNNYHTAFQLRLMPSPGATPNELPLPTPVIDFAKVTVLNPPWSGGGGGGIDTNAVERIANRAVETNAVTVGLQASVSGLSSSKADKSTTYTKVETDEMLAGKASVEEDATTRMIAEGAMNAASAAQNTADLAIEYGTSALEDLNAKANRADPGDDGELATLDEDGNPTRSGIAADDVAKIGTPVAFTEVDTSLFTSKEAVIGEPGFFVRIEDGSVVAPVDVKVDDVDETHSLRAKADRSMISATDPTFSNEVAKVAKTVTPTPTGTLRLFDPVLNRWVILKSVNMNLTLEVE